MITSADDIFRGVAVGGMFVTGMASLWLFSIGGLFEGEVAGKLFMLAGGVGLVSAWIAGHGVIVGAPLRAATASCAQGITTVLVLAWWVGTDFWGGTTHSDTSALPLLAVLVLDAAVLVWAVRQLGVREARC